MLLASARETVSGMEASITVKPPYDLADDDVARMLQKGFQSAKDDMCRRALAEERVEAEYLLKVLLQTLVAGGDLLSPEEHTAVDVKIVALRITTQGGDRRAIKGAVDALSHGTDEFAARRTDRGVRKALISERIKELG